MATEKKAPAAKKTAAPKAAKPAAAKKAPKTTVAKGGSPKTSGRYTVVAKTDAHSILKKKSGRYAVRLANRDWLKGEEKLKVLIAAGLVKAPTKKKEAAPAENA